MNKARRGELTAFVHRYGDLTVPPAGRAAEVDKLLSRVNGSGWNEASVRGAYYREWRVRSKRRSKKMAPPLTRLPLAPTTMVVPLTASSSERRERFRAAVSESVAALTLLREALERLYAAAE